MNNVMYTVKAECFDTTFGFTEQNTLTQTKDEKKAFETCMKLAIKELKRLSHEFKNEFKIQVLSNDKIVMLQADNKNIIGYYYVEDYDWS